MKDILVFSPPVPEEYPQPIESPKLGEVSGILKQEGYEFDQKSLFAECRYRNRNRFKKDVIDLSVFAERRVISYLKGEQDRCIIKEANKMADILDIESYDVVIVPLQGDSVISTRDVRLLMALPILKERITEEQIVIIGGPKITSRMEFLEFSFVDYVVDGDFEVPLLNIFRHEFEGEELVVEPGVMVERGGEVLCGEPYQHPMEMKPRPYFEPEILEKCGKFSLLNISVIPYHMGRGCTQNCSFCTYFEDQKYQHKSVDKVVKELKQLKKETGAEHVRFVDENLFSNPEHLKELAERFKEEGLDISWNGLSIIVSRDQEFFDTLAEGGCKALYHGIESASDSVLHRMRKHQTREMIENTLEKEYKAGINPFAGFITDYVDESWEEYNETVDFIKQNRHLMGAEATSLRIYPTERQPLYSNPEEFGIEINEEIGEDWRGIVHDYNISFEDSRGKISKAQDSQRQFKENYLQKLADRELFLKNYGRDYPITFLKLQLRKLYTKDYVDITHEYV